MKSAADHSVSSRRILTGLLGAPIAHSASPAMHERAVEALGFRCHYQLIEVAGTKGSLAVPTMQLWSYPGRDGWYAPLTCAEMKAASIDPLVEQLRYFLAVIARRETPLISVEDATGTLAVVEAVRKAARAGVSPRKIPE